MGNLILNLFMNSFSHMNNESFFSCSVAEQDIGVIQDLLKSFRLPHVLAAVQEVVNVSDSASRNLPSGHSHECHECGKAFKVHFASHF